MVSGPAEAGFEEYPGGSVGRPHLAIELIRIFRSPKLNSSHLHLSSHTRVWHLPSDRPWSKVLGQRDMYLKNFNRILLPRILIAVAHALPFDACALIKHTHFR